MPLYSFVNVWFKTHGSICCRHGWQIDPNQQPNTYHTFCLCSSLRGQEESRTMVRRFEKQNSKSITGKAKQKEKFIHFFPSADRCPTLSGKQGLRMCNGYLRRQMAYPWTFPLIPHFSELLLLDIKVIQICGFGFFGSAVTVSLPGLLGSAAY